MYAVLIAYTPETFPTKGRGSSSALTGTAYRISGIMTVADLLRPIIAMFANFANFGTSSNKAGYCLL